MKFFTLNPYNQDDVNITSWKNLAWRVGDVNMLLWKNLAVGQSDANLQSWVFQLKVIGKTLHEYTKLLEGD